jgi:hypothetical protein
MRRWKELLLFQLLMQELPEQKVVGVRLRRVLSEV